MPEPFTPSLVRQGIDGLLALHPHLDLVRVEWQETGEDNEDPAIAPRWGPWVLIELGQMSEGETRAFAIWDFAIWRTTGAVYTVRAGAVSDDPIFEP